MKTELAIGAGLGLVLVGVVAYVAKFGVPKAFNPTSSENLAYQGANSIGAAIAGERPEDFSLGARIWEWLNPSAVEAERRAVLGGGTSANRSSSLTPGAGGTRYWT